MKIILVEQATLFWDWTDSLSNEQTKQCIENSRQKIDVATKIQRAQKVVRWRVTRVFSPHNLFQLIVKYKYFLSTTFPLIAVDCQFFHSLQDVDCHFFCG